MPLNHDPDAPKLPPGDWLVRSSTQPTCRHCHRTITLRSPTLEEIEEDHLTPDAPGWAGDGRDGLPFYCASRPLGSCSLLHEPEEDRLAEVLTLREEGSARRDRPGEPLESGFQFRPGTGLSTDGRRRVLDKMDSVDAARRRAARDALTAYIG